MHNFVNFYLKSFDKCVLYELPIFEIGEIVNKIRTFKIFSTNINRYSH